MKKYPEEKIIAILREVEAGAKVAETCRKYGISDATYYYIVQNSSTCICSRRIQKVAEKKCRCLQQCRKTNAS